MKFNNFKQLVPKIQNTMLPGKEAHSKMASVKRLKEYSDDPLTYKNVREAAVLCCFYPDNDQEVHFVLTMRHTYQGVHSNQISFPGGKPEPTDSNLMATALREAEEEIGVLQDQIYMVRELSKVYIPPSNFLVQPYLGYIPEVPDFKIQESEVAMLVEVPVDYLLEDNTVGLVEMNTAGYGKLEVPAFIFNNFVVWGATAMMLNEVKHLLRTTM